nr:ribonuclease H-like domain-containing protein [Tanacetum cinerariifolium]
MATFEVLDELMEITASTELHKGMRFWFMQEISEEEGLLKFLHDRCDDLMRKNARHRVLIYEMKALRERGVVSMEALLILWSMINGLDASNHLFLPTNYNSNVPIVSVNLTTTDNYKMWSTAMKIALKGKNKMGFVDGTCIFDYKANQHLTVSTQNMFNVINISNINLTIGYPNGTLAKITDVGNIRLSANVVLFDVLIDLNLIKNVRTGNKSSGLYLFDVEQYGKCKCGLSNSVFVSHVPKQLRHSRLGHPSHQVMSILSKNIGLKYDNLISPCDICYKAKQTRDPFPLSDHKSESVGDLVHLDL